MTRKAKIIADDQSSTIALYNTTSPAQKISDGNQECRVCMQPISECRHAVNYPSGDSPVVEITPIVAEEFVEEYPQETQSYTEDFKDDRD